MRDELAQKLLRELLKNSKRSDRDLAKILNVSQATISRSRGKLEKDGMIDAYTIVPNFTAMGFELLALTFVKLHPDILTPEKKEEAKRYAMKFPSAILSALGEGMGKTGVVVSFHRNYTDFHQALNQLRLDWKDHAEDIQSFVISLETGVIKPFSLTYLKDVPI